MPQNVVVIFVHGMFNHRIQFERPMTDALDRELKRKQRRQYVSFATVNWTDVVLNQQTHFLRMATAAADIVDNRLRRLVVEGLGDAAAYQKTSDAADSKYVEIQECLRGVIRNKNKEPEEHRPLIFIGHSLGCHIISSYAWDMNKLRQVPTSQMAALPKHEQIIWQELQEASPFFRLETFAAFVTLGSNMPLFTFSFPPNRVWPITHPPRSPDGRALTPAFPGNKLDATRKDNARWLNFFNRLDLLGFPLQPLYSPNHLKGRLIDIPVESKGMKGWAAEIVPLLSHISAHTNYWTNPTVVKMTTELICEVIGP